MSLDKLSLTQKLAILLVGVRNRPVRSKLHLKLMLRIILKNVKGVDMLENAVCF